MTYEKISIIAVKHYEQIKSEVNNDDRLAALVVRQISLIGNISVDLISLIFPGKEISDHLPPYSEFAERGATR